MIQMYHSTSLLNKVPRILDQGKQQQKRRGTSLVPNGTFSFTEAIGANILNLAKQHQKGRAPLDGANAPNHNFTTKRIVAQVLGKAKHH